MLPTKGYFQDIECPYYDSSCGRPYCHFRHRKKATETTEEVASEPEKDEILVIPTYKPTPKSELANIHNNKSHIPISYVPDLAFRPDRKSRPLPKIDKPTYKPTPLSILSSANKREGSISEENGEHTEAIKEIKQNIANVEYNPAISLQPTMDIDFEDLSTEFDLIGEIINSSDKVQINISEDAYKEVDDTYKEVDDTLESEKQNDLNEISNDINKPKSRKEISTKHSDVKLGIRKLEQKQDGKKNKHKIGDEKIINKSEKCGDKKEKCSEKHSEKVIEKHDKVSGNDKKEKSGENHSKISGEKLGDKYEKYSDKKEKHYETVIEKSDKDSDKKEKNGKKLGEKHVESEKLKRIKHEKNNVRSEKNEKLSEKPKSKEKDRTEKTKSSKKDRMSDKEKSSSSKIKRIKETNEKCVNDKSHKSSSRDKHRKEEKRDRNKEERRDRNKEEKHSYKSKHKSKDRSRSRSKERQKSRDREKEKEKDKKHCDKSKNSSKSKNKDKHREKMNKKSGKDMTKDERKMHFDESSNDSDGNVPMLTDNFEKNFSDLDLDDDDETMLECYKIFNEYKPPEKTAVNQESEKKIIEDDFLTHVRDDNNIALTARKRIAHANAESTMTYSQLHPPNKPKIVNAPGQALTNRYKIAKLAQANKEQEFIINEIKQPTVANKRPAPTLLEAAREHKLRKEYFQQKPTQASSLVDDIIKGSSKPSILQSKITIKKIAPAQNVGLMEKAKERISKIKQTQIKTIAQTQKTGRVAHVPEITLSDIPDVLQADKSKLPVNVRTRFLTMLADECVKLYISKEEAFARALNEEFSCYEKCKVLATYRNSAMLAVNRIRKEIQEREKLGLGFIGLGEDPGKDSSSKYSGRAFYNKVKKWVLTEEELDIHGYPRESEEHHGRAVIVNRKNTVATNLDENQRICCRCHKIYQVDDDGWPLFEEECLYHPLKKRTIRGEQTYLCCRSNDGTGCATSDTHVSEGMNEAELEGFQTTMDPEYEEDPRSYAVYALDCEMCYTTKGLELTRVTIIDTECKTVYESFVKPMNPIIDYNTRFSGITKEQMDKTSTSILQIQANILHLCNSKTILVGHSLESDMKALKIVHGTVIDTSVLFPHKMGLPHKRALKALASELLRKIIQNDISGHDSAEDAVTCMELVKWKLKEELKTRGSK